MTWNVPILGKRGYRMFSLHIGEAGKPNVVRLPDGEEVALDDFRKLARWALAGGLEGMPGDPWHDGKGTFAPIGSGQVGPGVSR